MQTGQTLAHYKVEEKIGVGGMGEVYRAHDTTLGRDVALKILPSEFAADSDRFARFQREAKVLASLHHSNIASIFGFETTEECTFLVMELVEGKDLSELLKSGPLPVNDAIAIACQIAEGLEEAHEKGIIHRDLKPANVKCTSDGKVKLLDFGLARMDLPSDSASTLDATQDLVLPQLATTVGTLMGTVPYMSPEQARGEPVGKRSDIWSLAVILYECLTGTNPFIGPTTSDTIAAILTSKVDLEVLPLGTPHLISHILRRGFERDLHSRWRDAGDLRLLFEDCLEAMPTAPEISLDQATVVDKTFLIDDDICRSLESDGFDPHLIGWQMQYADNERQSKVLQLWIPSFGEDHSMGIWRDLLASAPCRTIVATPVGFEPDVDHRPHLSLNNQLILLRHLATSVVAKVRPEKVVVAGFS